MGNFSLRDAVCFGGKWATGAVSECKNPSLSCMFGCQWWSWKTFGDLLCWHCREDARIRRTFLGAKLLDLRRDTDVSKGVFTLGRSELKSRSCLCSPTCQSYFCFHIDTGRSTYSGKVSRNWQVVGWPTISPYCTVAFSIWQILLFLLARDQSTYWRKKQFEPFFLVQSYHFF